MDILVNIIVVNCLWIVFSIPVITSGASTCAAFSVMLKLVNGEEVKTGKMFVKAFKNNFKQGTIMGLIAIPTIFGCYKYWEYIIKGDNGTFLITVGAIIVTALVVCINFYSFPLIARYENTLKNTIRNSTVLSLLYLVRTIITLAILALEIVVITWGKWTLFAGIFFGPGLIIFTISAMSKKIFKIVEGNGGMIVAPIATPDSEEEALEDSDLEIEDNDDEEEADV